MAGRKKTKDRPIKQEKQKDRVELKASMGIRVNESPTYEEIKLSRKSVYSK